MKTIISLLLIFSFSITDEIKTELSKMSEEELIKLFIQAQKKIDKSNKEVAEAKAETKSAKKVNEKLDEIIGILEKDKK